MNHLNCALENYPKGKEDDSPKHIELDGESLTTYDLYRIGHDASIKVEIADKTYENIAKARKIVTDKIENGEIVYGINTGFGHFSTVSIGRDAIAKLQYNLIQSHATGVGTPIALPIARMLLTLRINVLCKARSGIRPITVKKLLAALNANCISQIPCQGTVGASGDLAPLSHLALGLIGQGEMWNPTKGAYDAAAKVLKEHNLAPIELEAKEGLSLINGTQFICAVGVEALERARLLAIEADIVAALTVDALLGTFRAYDARIHANRPHSGQQMVAKRMRQLLIEPNGDTSSIYKSHSKCSRVQDAYTLRCIPQVHGVVHDTINFVTNTMTTEINSATDNPMVFYDLDDSCLPEAQTGYIVSGGNFHGEYPAKMMDYLGIAIHEIAQISERRTARMIDHTQNNGLPAFLIENGGLNSGFMLAHCTAASLTSENKVLVHPSSSDTISTSAQKEDHVSMGGFAARKALNIVENVERIVAIEALAASQALYIRQQHADVKPSTTMNKVLKTIRSKVPPIDADRYFAPDINAVTNLIRDGSIYRCVHDRLIMKDDLLNPVKPSS